MLTGLIIYCIETALKTLLMELQRKEVRETRGRRRKQLLDYLKGKRVYWELKKEALDRTLWRTRFGRGYGPVVRLTAYWWHVPILMEIIPLYFNKSMAFCMDRQSQQFVVFNNAKLYYMFRYIWPSSGTNVQN
jgi:hypothetical protein